MDNIDTGVPRALSYREFQIQLHKEITRLKLFRSHLSITGPLWETRAFTAIDRAIIELDRAISGD